MITKLFETIKCENIVFQIWEDGEVTPTHLFTPEVQEYVGDLFGVYRVDFDREVWKFIQLEKLNNVVETMSHIRTIEKNWKKGITNNSLYGIARFKNGKVIPFNTL